MPYTIYFRYKLLNIILRIYSQLFDCFRVCFMSFLTSFYTLWSYFVNCSSHRIYKQWLVVKHIAENSLIVGIEYDLTDIPFNRLENECPPNTIYESGSDCSSIEIEKIPNKIYFSVVYFKMNRWV